MQADELSYVYQTRQTRTKQTAGLNSQVTTPTWMFSMESQCILQALGLLHIYTSPNKEGVPGLSSVNAVSTCPRVQGHKHATITEDSAKSYPWPLVSSLMCSQSRAAAPPSLPWSSSGTNDNDLLLL